MSHTSTIKSVTINSESAIRAAVKELAAAGIRISLLEKATPRAYFANQAGMGLADFVLHIPDARYDVGLYKQADGTFEARTDFHMGSVASVLGAAHTGNGIRSEQAALGKFFQAYNLNRATEQARAMGHEVRRVAGNNGLIKLEVTGNRL